MKDKTVLFICKGNSGRSQMAQAIFSCSSKGWKAMSAGTNPDEKIHPWTVEVMKEIQIDVSQKKPRLLTFEMLEKADKVIVMDSEVLKEIPPKYLSKVEDWKIGKLLGKSIEEIREIRDEIKKKVEKLLEEL